MKLISFLKKNIKYILISLLILSYVLLFVCNFKYNSVFLIKSSYFLIFFLSIYLYNLLFNKQIEKINTKLKYMIYIIEFIVSIIFALSIYKIIYFNVYQNYIHIVYLIISLISINILSIIFSLNLNKQKIEKIFLLITIPIGIFYLIFIIPNYIPDENMHYYTSYNYVNGDFILTDYETDVPDQFIKNNYNEINSYDDLDNIIRWKANYDDTTSIATASYNFIVYLPSTVGIFIGKILNLPIYLGYYLARLLCFIVFLIGGYYIIKLLPFGKIVGFVYLLNPMMIHQSISISADTMINLACLLFISYILKLRFSEENITTKKITILTLLLIFIGISKYVYIPLVLLLLLLIPKINKKDKKIFLLSFVLPIIICVVAYIYFNFIVKALPNPYLIENNVNTVEQIKDLIAHPFNIFRMYHNTYLRFGDYYLNTFLGSQLGWLDIYINGITTKLYFILFILSPFLVKEKKELNIYEKILFIVLSIIMILITILGLYFSWSPVGSLVSLGVQGRYFIPFMILILFAMIGNNKYIKIKNLNYFLTIILFIIHFDVINTLILSFI